MNKVLTKVFNPLKVYLHPFKSLQLMVVGVFIFYFMVRSQAQAELLSQAPSAAHNSRQ